MCTAIDHLSSEPISIILPHFLGSILDVNALGQTCKALRICYSNRRSIDLFTKNLNNSIEQFGLDTNLLHFLLRIPSFVLSGSTLLQGVIGEKWTDSDLDFFCDHEEAKNIIVKFFKTGTRRRALMELSYDAWAYFSYSSPWSAILHNAGYILYPYDNYSTCRYIRCSQQFHDGIPSIWPLTYRHHKTKKVIQIIVVLRGTVHAWILQFDFDFLKSSYYFIHPDSAIARLHILSTTSIRTRTAVLTIPPKKERRDKYIHRGFTIKMRNHIQDLD